MPTYNSKDKTLEVSGSAPNGDAVGPISFKSGSYTTKDEGEIAVLDALALIEDSPVSFEQKNKGE